jgi:hypothetical protein
MNGLLPVDDAGMGVDGSEGADADGHHRGPMLRGGFEVLVSSCLLLLAAISRFHRRATRRRGR